MRARLAVIAVLVAMAPAAAARACPLPIAYPGDAAPAATIAQWMANGALAAGLPAELPAMAALVESGVANLPPGDTDSAGYFGMRISIWEATYPSFETTPDLQLRWFTDQATATRAARIARGIGDPLADPNQWGDWIADVERPAEQYRGRYQIQLATAQALIGPPCPGSPVVGMPVPVAAPDLVPPALRLSGARRQHAVHRGSLLIRTTCSGEACIASGTGTIRPPGAKRTVRVGSRPRHLGVDASADVRLVLSARLRRILRRALDRGAPVRARVLITVADVAGNQASAHRTVRVTG